MKHIASLLKKNPLVFLFACALLAVVVLAAGRTLFKKDTYVYARVKLGQGLWWVAGAKPNTWMVSAIRPGTAEVDLMGKEIAKVMWVRYYPWYTSNQYDVYLTLKLVASYNKKTRQYTYNRSTLSVGSPVDFNFSDIQVSGTVVELSSRPFEEKMTEKTIVLVKKGSYAWEYEGIQIGDTFFDGKDTVLRVIDKSAMDTAELTNDMYGNATVNTVEAKKYLIVKMKVKVKIINNQYVYGEESILIPGKSPNFTTSRFSFNEFVIESIE